MRARVVPQEHAAGARERRPNPLVRRRRWAFKQAERLGAKRLVIVGSDEWARGCVVVKDLTARDQVEVRADELV
jgi:histidyl-tRNA synthetase